MLFIFIVLVSWHLQLSNPLALCKLQFELTAAFEGPCLETLKGPIQGNSEQAYHHHEQSQTIKSNPSTLTLKGRPQGPAPWLDVGTRISRRLKLPESVNISKEHKKFGQPR